METRRWTNPTQPQTLQSSVILLYVGAAFSILFGGLSGLGVAVAGLRVAAVEGDPLLEKLTTPADWARAEDWLATRLVVRTGMGFDVHRKSVV